METTAITTKQSLDALVTAIGVETATKKDITALATEVAENSSNPLLATVACKPLEEFLTQLKAALKERALKIAEDTPESKRRIGNITYNVINRKNYNFKEDETWTRIKSDLSELEGTIKKENGVSTTETTYMTVNIPKN